MPKVAEVDGITGKYYKHANLLLTLNSSYTSCSQVYLDNVLCAIDLIHALLFSCGKTIVYGGQYSSMNDIFKLIFVINSLLTPLPFYYLLIS